MPVVDLKLVEEKVGGCQDSLTLTSVEGEVGIEAGAGGPEAVSVAGGEVEAGEGEVDAESDWESIPDSDLEAPSSGKQPATADEEADLAVETQDAQSVAASFPSSVEASADSESSHSDIVAPSDDVTEETEARVSESQAIPKTPASVPAEPTKEAPAAGESPSVALDSIKEIRDLVMEVIEVEEMIQHYPLNTV